MPAFLPDLKSLGYLDRLNFAVCIIGSRQTGSEQWLQTAQALLTSNLSIYGFDADPEACEEMNTKLESQQVPWHEVHIPIALSNSNGEATLYITPNLFCCSLYPPNEEYTSRFLHMGAGIRTDATVEIDTVTLDDFLESEKIEEVDFLQIDVQGADLDVIKGATRTVQQSVLGIQIEVEFSPIYIDQPLFSDIDAYLRSRDFYLFDLETNYNWSRLPRACSPVFSKIKKGQLLWGDALYLKEPFLKNESEFLKQPDRILKLACWADIFDFVDYAAELLRYLTIEYGDDPAYNFAEILVNSVAKFSEVTAQQIEDFPIFADVRHRLPEDYCFPNAEKNADEKGGGQK